MAKEKYTDELISYFRKNLKKGYTKESLKWALVQQGHSKLEIEKAIRVVESEMAAKAPILKTKPEIKVEVIASNSKNKNEKSSFWKRLFG